MQVKDLTVLTVRDMWREVEDSHVRMAFSNASVEHLAEAGRRLRKVFLRLVD